MLNLAPIPHYPMESMLKEYSSDLLIHEQLTLKNPLTISHLKSVPCGILSVPIWIYVNSDIALFCQTPDLRSMMAKAWYQQQLPMADTDPCWSQHSFQIWWKDWPSHHLSTSLLSLSFVYMTNGGDWPIQALLVGFDFFFFVFHRKRCDKSARW